MSTNNVVCAGFTEALSQEQIQAKVTAVGGVIASQLNFATNLFVLTVPDNTDLAAARVLSADPECMFAEVDRPQRIGPRR